MKVFHSKHRAEETASKLLSKCFSQPPILPSHPTSGHLRNFQKIAWTWTFQNRKWDFQNWETYPWAPRQPLPDYSVPKWFPLAPIQWTKKRRSLQLPAAEGTSGGAKKTAYAAPNNLVHCPGPVRRGRKEVPFWGLWWPPRRASSRILPKPRAEKTSAAPPPLQQKCLISV